MGLGVFLEFGRPGGTKTADQTRQGPSLRSEVKHQRPKEFVILSFRAATNLYFLVAE